MLPTVHYNMGGIPTNYRAEVVVPRDGDDRLAVLRIDRHVALADLTEGLQDPRRTATGVLIQVQPQTVAGIGISLYHHHFTLILIDAACAFSPSAAARVVTVSPSRRRPACVTR